MSLKNHLSVHDRRGSPESSWDVFARFDSYLRKNLFSGSTKIALIACLIGIATGVMIGIYTLLLKMLTGSVGYASSLLFLYQLPGWLIILTPAIGGLAVGLLIRYSLKIRYGVSSVIEAAALHGGRLHAKYAILEAFASVITIGTGGSAGKEAPGVLMGSGVSSLIAKIFGIKGQNLRIFLGCGAAAGVAAAFNAPLAGIVFVMEVIIGELETRTFIPVVLSSVFSTFVFNVFFGSDALTFPVYSLSDPFTEIWLFLILGFLAGVVSVIFIRSFYAVRELFTKLPVNIMFKPAIGGLVVGIIGFFCPQVLGLGYDTIIDVVTTPGPVTFLIFLMVMKMLAFSFTLGSRGAGGSIVPSMFVGAVLGSLFGVFCNAVVPGITIETGAYAVAGMGAVFAGTSNAMFTSMILLAEMTHDYNMILPFTFACVIGNAVTRALHPESVFTEMLRRKGYSIREGREVDVMSSLLVKDAMNTSAQTVSAENSAAALVSLMKSSRHAGFPVIGKDGSLAGIVTLSDTRDKLIGVDPETVLIKDIMTKDLIVAYPHETLDVILDRFISGDISHVPVVMKSNPKKLLGIITRSDIFKTYNKHVLMKVRNIDTYESEISAAGPGIPADADPVNPADADPVNPENGDRENRPPGNNIRQDRIPERRPVRPASPETTSCKTCIPGNDGQKNSDRNNCIS